MPKINAQIEAVERKIEQNQNRLKDLKTQATKQKRKDDARRKLLYGAAYFVALDTLSPDARLRSRKRIEKHITRAKDREFLGLEPLVDDEQEAGSIESGDGSVTLELPFEKS